MLKKVTVAVVILILAVLIFAATRPDTFHVQRATSINAPPETIFALINDFHEWGAWSPFERLDPAMSRIYGGAPSGQGSVYEWKGNGRAGAGRIKIAESSPPSKLTINLDFVKPIEGHNIIEFTLEPRGGATDVTWAMHGSNPYLAKVMSIFCSMDKMVGKDFETGLANLKSVAEKLAGDAIRRRS